VFSGGGSCPWCAISIGATQVHARHLDTQEYDWVVDVCVHGIDCATEDYLTREQFGRF